MAAATPPFAPDVPVAVVTAGGVSDANAGRKAVQAAPAKAALHGYVDHVEGAGPQYRARSDVRGPHRQGRGVRAGACSTAIAGELSAKLTEGA